MKRLLTAITLAGVIASTAFAQTARRPGSNESFASDNQVIPVVANTTGANGATFQSYVALLNPTASAFPVTATLYDANGTKSTATITLAAGELKTYTNFLGDLFHLTGGGAVRFQSAPSAGGTNNNRFIVTSEVWTTAGRYSTSIPALEFAGSSSRAFSGGISVDSGSRTNIGCFNQGDGATTVKATVRDASGQQIVGTINLNLPANAWGQTAVSSVVSNGYVQFDPSDSAVCYAVVVDNTTNDGRFVAAVPYTP